MKRFFLILILWLIIAGFVGCTTTHSSYEPTSPQISRGRPFLLIDFFGSVLLLPEKIILFNWKFGNHKISTETEAALVDYLQYRNLPFFEKTQFRLNEYDPIGDFKALLKNKDVAWPFRLFLGFPTTLITDILLPGRLFPWGDYYNPYTNVVHLYSDLPVVAFHEGGHAYDSADFPHKGTYAFIRIIPLIDLYQEKCATSEAVNYLREIGDRELEMEAYKLLWPAYGTYVGSYFPVPFGSIAGAVVGHLIGRIKMVSRSNYYRRMDDVFGPQFEMENRFQPQVNKPAADSLSKIQVG